LSNGCVTDHQGKIWLGDYRIIRRLGSGTFGQVWLAKKQSTGDHVAVKMVAHSRVSMVEKEVHLRAVGHPFIVQLFSFFETKVSYRFKQSMCMH
jgi:serine/threonine protein kinase